MCVILYVAGYILNVIPAGLFIQPLKSNVILLKQKDNIVTEETWSIAVDIDVNVFEGAVSTIKADLILFESQKQEFTPIF